MPLSAKELYLPTKDITAFEEKVRTFSSKSTIVLQKKYYRFKRKVLSFFYEKLGPFYWKVQIFRLKGVEVSPKTLFPFSNVILRKVGLRFQQMHRQRQLYILYSCLIDRFQS